MGNGRFGRLLGFWVLAWLALASAQAAWGSVRYVKADATGTNAGTSWANAYASLQTALGAAAWGDEIWIAAGTYKPTTGTDRTISFVMPSNVAIYGGFAGTETARGQRDWSAHVTILSGDIGTIGTATDNSYHVVVGANSAVLDGFTITGGNANGSNASANGGGMINDSVSPTVANCTFTNNTATEDYGSGDGDGGGMENDGGSPTVTNCTFTNNTACGYNYDGDGGGMENDGGSPTVTNCTFTSNTADDGGGMCNSDSSPTVTNCTFTSNAAGDGGGMNNYYDSSPTVTNCTFTNNTTDGYGGGMAGGNATNCTFTNNTAFDGGGMENDGYSPTVTNCTFTNNTADYGGGMDNTNASPTVTNCTFTNNTANGTYGCGGGMLNSTSLTVTNCTFTNNTAGYGGGGGMYNESSSSSTVTNCTFTNNAAWDGWGGGMYNSYASPTVTNCILWNSSATTGAQVYNDSGTPTFKYCDIEGSGASGAQWNTALGTDGGGNIMADPLFAIAASPAGPDGIPRTSDDGLRLLVGSPCIDAGTTDGAPTTDILGNPRVGLPDIGAYEYQTPPGAPTVTSAAALTNNAKPTWTWVSDGGGGNGTFRCQLDSTTGTWTTTTATTYTPSAALAEGAHALYVEEENSDGYWSAVGSYTVTVDTTPPGKPTVTSAAALTNNAKPTWTWASGGGGNGTFRYQLDSTTGTWTTTTGTSYTPPTALAEGTHTLYVKERDAAGNWSASGNYAVTVDTTPPGSPVVTSAAAATNNTKPTWTWTGGGGGNGTFRYQRDSTTGAWTMTTGTSYTPATALADGSHALYVEERDAAGNWSLSGSYAVTVDTTPPGAPTVKAALIAARRPIWTWASGGGGDGTFQYQLDAIADAGWTTTTATTWSQELSLGAHVFYVRERDDAGNWSAIGSCSIATIDAAQDWRGYR
jgi:hypothetical protein